MDGFHITADEARRETEFREAWPRCPLLASVFGDIRKAAREGKREIVLEAWPPEDKDGTITREGRRTRRWDEFRDVCLLLEKFGFVVSARFGGGGPWNTWYPWQHLDNLDNLDDREAGASRPLSWKAAW